MRLSFLGPHFVVTIISMHRNGVYINAQGWIGIPRHQNVGYGFQWRAIFWRAYIHFSLVRVADIFEQHFTRGFWRVQNQRRAAFYFSTEFLGCAECECFAGAVSHCSFALCVASKLAWLGACI